MASNEVSDMFAAVDIVKKLEEFRYGCDMGEREYIWRDEAANLLIEENDVMIRLFQGINKAVMDKEKYDGDIAEGYTTLEEVKERWKFSRHGLRTQHVASGMIKSLGEDNKYWKEYYHELVVDDKLIQSDLEQFMRSLQYTGDQGWNILLDKLVEFQNQTVDAKNQVKNRLMQTIKVFFLITQHLPPMRRVWERKEEIMPILVQKCMGQSYDLLRQTTLVIILHLILAAKSTDDIDWLAIDCDFAKKLLHFLESTSFLKERVAPLVNHVMLAYIALLELGGEKTRQKVKSLDIDKKFRRLMQDPKAANPKKEMTTEETFTKGLVQTYLTLAEDHTAVTYFTKYPREKRIAFRWEYRGVPVFCSNTECARPQEPQERFRHCSRCMVTYYCSSECQKQHWKTAKGGPRHKDVCVPLPESKRRKAADTSTDSAGVESKADTNGEGTESTKVDDSSAEGAIKNENVEEGATGGESQETAEASGTTAMLVVPGNSEDYKDGKKEPTAEDIRNEVEQKVSKYGLTVESVQKIDCRNNPTLQQILQKIL